MHLRNVAGQLPPPGACGHLGEGPGMRPRQWERSLVVSADMSASTARKPARTQFSFGHLMPENPFLRDSRNLC